MGFLMLVSMQNLKFFMVDECGLTLMCDRMNYFRETGQSRVNLSPKDRQGLKSLSNSESPLKRTEELISAQSSKEDFRYEAGV
ncbi:MAG: hypothetical protein EAZ60_14550 [Oscillatoriales cyanobacterium]|nr:MAG: hypothetical protein EAZ83_06825 [Oscillatoriales cyanobacterium]TAE94773.1 MAG: hypothetical protein EAZ79_22010 [Oscillatoriales cyanobacterium]TAF22188.1 MAG: hypothetical protein EAZ73_06390 [Oscillatoriales cyanobacterium]TAF36826.1 MAG: hypothetical protein EAZ69_08930 [Oscillatoriales cyanobacterium]TAF55040.1 MAG: hypothetical protein EAZ60_14550 [Oscillatoriales cyanobacterium]